MNNVKKLSKGFFVACLISLWVSSVACVGTNPERPKSHAAMTMTTQVPESIVVPDKIETRLGTLEFFDGFPSKKTAETMHDYLYFHRAVDVFLDEMRAASILAIRQGFKHLGVHECRQIAVFEDLMDSKALWLTANTETVYASNFLNLKKDGPVVIESPPNVLGILDDMWMLLLFILGTTVQEFTRSIPAYQLKMKQLIGDGYNWLLAHNIAVDKSMLDAIFDPGKIMKFVTSLLNSTMAILKNVFFIVLMFAFLIIEAGGIPDKIKAIRQNKEDSLASYNDIVGMVNRYLGIKFITSLITGVLLYLGLVFLGVDFAFLWGVLSFLLNFVPTIGSLIASIPAILLALVQLGPVYALGTALLFFAVNTVVGSIAEPRIMGQRVGLSSIVVLLSLIFWGWVLGPMGMLLSVPLTMTVKIALSENESTQWISILLAPNSELAGFKKP